MCIIRKALSIPSYSQLTVEKRNCQSVSMRVCLNTRDGIRAEFSRWVRFRPFWKVFDGEAVWQRCARACLFELVRPTNKRIPIFFVRSNLSGMVPNAFKITGNSKQKCSPECHLCLIHPHPYNQNIRAIYFDILTHYFVYEHWIFNTDYFYLCVEMLQKCSLMTLSLFRRNIIDSISLFNVQ